MSTNELYVLRWKDSKRAFVGDHKDRVTDIVEAAFFDRKSKIEIFARNVGLLDKLKSGAIEVVPVKTK